MTMSVSSRCDKTEWKVMKRERRINEAGQDETNTFLYEETILNITRPKYNVVERAV